MLTPTRDQTRNLRMCPDWGWTRNFLVYGTMLQPTESPGEGTMFIFMEGGFKHKKAQVC